MVPRHREGAHRELDRRNLRTVAPALADLTAALSAERSGGISHARKSLAVSLACSSQLLLRDVREGPTLPCETISASASRASCLE